MRSHFATLTIIVSLFFAGCGGSSSSGSIAIIDGDSDSPIVQALVRQGLLIRQSDDAGVKPALIIVDASKHSPEKIASDELLIDEALAQKIPLLLVDADSSDITEGIFNHTGVALSGDHAAFLIRTREEVDGTFEFPSQSYPVYPSSDLITIPEVESGELTIDVNAFQAAHDEGSSRYYDEQAQEILTSLEMSVDALFPGQELNTRNDTNNVFLTDNKIDGVLGGTGCEANPKSYWRHLIVDNRKAAELTVNSELFSQLHAWTYYDPGSDNFKIIFNYSGIAYVGADRVLAQEDSYSINLYQKNLRINVSSDTPGAFFSQFSPANVNNATTYTDSVSTTISGSIDSDGKAEVGGSRQVTHSVQKTITDWSIENQSTSSSSAEWYYFQTRRTKLPYQTLPALSRENIDVSNSTVWQVPYDETVADKNGRRTFTIKITPTRQFGFAATRTFDFGGIGLFKPATNQSVELKCLLPEVPATARINR